MQQPPLMAAPLRACSSRHPRGTMARWVANIAITPPSPGPATSARVPPATAKPGPRRVGQGQADAARQLRFRLPRGPKRWNPEELLVAGLSQCHMLWILHLRGVNGIVVTSCTDDDQDTMAEGGGEFATVTLRSRAAITDSGKANRSLELHEEPTGSALSPARSTSPSAASRSSPDHQTRLTPGPCESAWYCRSSVSPSRTSPWLNGPTLQPVQTGDVPLAQPLRQCPEHPVTHRILLSPSNGRTRIERRLAIVAGCHVRLSSGRSSWPRSAWPPSAARLPSGSYLAAPAM